MAKVFDSLDASLVSFIRAQQMFFVATAPLAADGHPNVSPKGLDTLAVIDERTVAYLDLTGSGAETIAHLRENGRIVLMWCAFSGPPKILRVHGRGRVVFPHEPEFARLALHFPSLPGSRAIIVVQAERISDSCGYGVPEYRFEKQRDQLNRWAEHKGEDGLRAYRRDKNARSLDGLPAVPEEGE